MEPGDIAFAEPKQDAIAAVLIGVAAVPERLQCGNGIARVLLLAFRSQLALLGMLNVLGDTGSQFVVATHSPLLLALPGATIYEFGDAGVHPRDWADLDVLRDVRAFLESPDRFFCHLLE